MESTATTITETPTTTEGDSQGTSVRGHETSQTQEESFFDPNNVPEELKPAYKQMQAAFTKKTQEIATAKKEAESLKANADKYARYEKYAPILEEMLSKEGDQQFIKTPEVLAIERELASRGYSKEAIDLAVISSGVLLKQINQSQATAKQQERLTQQIGEAEKIDPRLNDHSIVYTAEDGSKKSYGEIVAAIVRSSDNWQSDPVTATKQAIKIVDAIVGNAKVEGKKELSDSARTKAKQFAPTNSSSQTTQPTGSPASMREAADLAKQELGL